MREINFIRIKSEVPTMYANILKEMERNAVPERAESAKSFLLTLLATCTGLEKEQRDYVLKLYSGTFANGDVIVQAMRNIYNDYDALYESNIAIFSKEQFDEVFINFIAVEIGNLSR